MNQQAHKLQTPPIATALRYVFGRHQHLRGVPRLLWWLRRLAFPPRPVLVNTPDGLPITINPHDYGQIMLFYFPYCPELRALIADVVRPGDVCFDLGANVGLLTAKMAQQVGTAGKVIAVDPNTAVAAQLSFTANLYYPQQIRVVEAGIAGNVGVAQLMIPKGGFSESVEVAPKAEHGKELTTIGNQIKLTTLDKLIEELTPQKAPNFIKVDIEGNEVELLASMKKLLAGGARPILLIELHVQKCLRHGSNVEHIREQLNALGYDERRVERVGQSYQLSPLSGKLLRNANLLFTVPEHFATRPYLLAQWQKGQKV